MLFTKDRMEMERTTRSFIKKKSSVDKNIVIIYDNILWKNTVSLKSSKTAA